MYLAEGGGRGAGREGQGAWKEGGVKEKEKQGKRRERRKKACVRGRGGGEREWKGGEKGVPRKRGKKRQEARNGISHSITPPHPYWAHFHAKRSRELTISSSYGGGASIRMHANA
jgi:hypothetical protein